MEKKINELDNWLLAKAQELIHAIVKEEYENAAIINGDIDDKIEKATTLLKRYKLPAEEMRAELIDTKYSYIGLWQDHYNLPREHRIKNI